MLRATAILATALSVGVFGARSASALEFRTVNDTAAVLYDAPSARSQKLYILNRGYPVEVIVAVEGWVKVRDAQGGLAWIEAKQLTDKRTVLIRAPVAQIRQKPDDAAPVVFQAQQNVLLELIDVAGTWVQVRHRDGGTGYVKAQQVWGA
jgi:SH3-like domain-containing protein